MENTLIQFLESRGVDRTWTVFLDRDGVINERIPDDYVTRLEQFVFLPGALEGMEQLSRIFGRMIVVTNQRGIALGRMTEEDLKAVHKVLWEEALAAGALIDGIYHCPHDRDVGCGCRKPGVGMPLKAELDFPGIDFGKSVMIGDSISDLEMGRKLGMITCWITGKGEKMPNSLWDWKGERLHDPT